MSNENKEVIRAFLERIRDDIAFIDGGCSRCVNDFCDGVNEVLTDYDLKLSIPHDSFHITVQAEDLE